MPPRVTTASSPKRTKKKGVIHERKRHKINSKGWLETPADWVRFDAWAEVNAKPRKIPEPEPIVRLSRPLSQLKKRIKVLSLPMKKTDESAVCRLDLGVSKAALKAKPSKRIKKLAKFTFKETDVIREFPMKIRKAALRYEPSERIIEISRPLIRIPEECKALEVSQKALKHKTTNKERMMALSKKAVECPDFLTDKEREKLMTQTGIMKSALTYEFTPWMSLLSLPFYRCLKDRDDKKAKAWKKKIIEELETRGKKALEEKLGKEQKKKKKRVGKRREEKQKKEESVSQGEEINQGSAEENKDEEMKTQKNEAKGGRKRNRKETSENDSEESEEAKRRRIERNAWRFAPSPVQEIGIKKSALKATASERVKELSKANVRKSQAYWENPFEVRKSALSASASARISEMANPINPSEPVEKPPPREKDKFGRPIFPMPAYGKVLPEVKYKKPECKTEEKDEKSEKSQEKVSKLPPLNPIVFESSIDPYLDPQRAKIQKNERRKLAQRKKKSDRGGK